MAGAQRASWSAMVGPRLCQPIRIERSAHRAQARRLLLADRNADIGALPAPLRVLQPDFRKVPVGSGVVDIADPDAAHLRGPRRLDQTREPRHHRLDLRQVAAFAMHGTTFGAEVILYVDDQDCAVLRTNFVGERPQHGASPQGLKNITLTSNGLTILCRTAMSRLAWKLGMLNSVENCGRVTSLTTSSFMPVNFDTHSSRSSLDVVAMNSVARS